MSWFSSIADNFNDKEILVPTPPILKIEDKINVNPNNFEKIVTTQNVSWCLETWNSCIKKKYKKYIRKWDTKTGMGRCQPEDFSISVLTTGG